MRLLQRQQLWLLPPTPPYPHLPKPLACCPHSPPFLVQPPDLNSNLSGLHELLLLGPVTIVTVAHTPLASGSPLPPPPPFLMHPAALTSSLSGLHELPLLGPVTIDTVADSSGHTSAARTRNSALEPAANGDLPPRPAEVSGMP